MQLTPIEELDHRQYILIKNARQNNLKSIDLAIPQNKLVVITGVSGSGKSSLAFDTLYAEGQRRYIESLSSYIRQFLGKIDKPEVDYIKGLAPAVAIQQKVRTSNPRSTVGTSTEIYDYLKLLYARVGKTFSPGTGKEVKRHTVEDVADFFKATPAGTRAQILARVVPAHGRSIAEEFNVILQKGFPRLEIDGRIMKIEEVLEFINDADQKDGMEKFLQTEKSILTNSYILIDRIVNKKEDEDNDARISDSLQTAFFEGHGECVLEIVGKESNERHFFSNRFEEDGIAFEEPSVNLFTFNSPHGACPVCEGFGQTIGVDEEKVIPDRTLSVYEDAVACWKGEKMSEWKDDFVLKAEKLNFPVHRPYNQLTEKEIELLWEGKGSVKGINDFFGYLERKSYKIQYRVLMARYKGKTKCPACKGKRLRKEATYVKVGNHSITDLVDLSIENLLEHISTMDLSKKDKEIADRILTEVTIRLALLNDVGLSYLTINRPSNTLSGGESQRIQLVTSLGSNLVGSLYILDEPSVGLHPRDNDRLINVLKNLRDLGNTCIVVEHDEEIIRAADEIIDIGPHAGRHGGEVVFQGSLEELYEKGESYTAKYIRGEEKIYREKNYVPFRNFIEIKGAFKHNLKNIDIKIPLKGMTVVSGVSGSGKSTLTRDVIYKSLKGAGGRISPDPANCHSVEVNTNLVTAIEYVDQNPLGRSSRSNPVTYLKAFDPIRELFSNQPLSKISGYTPAHFSFNVEGGRCENCRGEGTLTIEMQFMADILLPCEVCRGKRYKDEVLKVTWKDKNIADVLDMTIDEAVEFFSDHPSIAEQLQPLLDVGLGYLKMGQPSINLSGGEAQRVKLASFLSKSGSKDPVLFIFDEPTTGLHFHDIHNLLRAFTALNEKGHTVLIVEHNLDIIKNADWVIDLGPEGGDAGGNLVYQGPASELPDVEGSYTATYLNQMVNKD